MADHSPEPMVGLPNHRQDQGFEKQLESRSLPRPGHGDQMHPVLGALHLQYPPGVQVGRMLKEVLVVPDLLLGVMDRAFLTTDQVSELAALREIHMQVQKLLLHRKQTTRRPLPTAKPDPNPT